MPPLGPQANWQSQVFKPFRKAKSVGADLTLEDMRFQRVEAIEETALLLDPNCQKYLNSRFAGGRTGQSHWDEIIPQVNYPADVHIYGCWWWL